MNTAKISSIHWQTESLYKKAIAEAKRQKKSLSAYLRDLAEDDLTKTKKGQK